MTNWNRERRLRPRDPMETEEPWNLVTDFLDTKTRALLDYLKRSDLDSYTRIRIQEALQELSHKGGDKFVRIIRQQSFPYENGIVVLDDGTINRYVAREETQVEEECPEITHEEESQPSWEFVEVSLEEPPLHEMIDEEGSESETTPEEAPPLFSLRNFPSQ